MRRMLAGAAAGCVLLGLAATGPSLASPTTTRPVITPDAPIEHVVIIYQENHTFDDVLGTVCVDPARVNPCNGYIGPVTFFDGTTAENVVQPDAIPVIDHQPSSQRRAMLNKWNRINGCRTPPYYCVSHVDPANMVNLAALANQFVVSDATFAAGRNSSFAAHVTLGAGTVNGFSGDNPIESVKGVKPRDGWGCYSRLDALWAGDHGWHYEPSCIPDKRGRGPYRPSHVPYAPTIMERLEEAGLTWHMYEGGDETTGEPNLTNWSVCTYFEWCWRNRWSLDYDSPRQNFVRMAQSGDLPNLSILIPSGATSQHNLTSMRNGDNYIGEMVSAAMSGPDWNSTAIFITYDDCGCFYDHVIPENKSKMGLRNPMVIISPWAKPQGVDSTPAIQPYSALAFVEHLFGLAPLSSEVTHAYDYANSFDFTQQPLSGIRMVHSKVPGWEKRLVARNQKYLEDDPT